MSDRKEYYSSLDIYALRWECEMKLAHECYYAEKSDPENHVCRCPDPSIWDLEKCFKFLGVEQ